MYSIEVNQYEFILEINNREDAECHCDWTLLRPSGATTDLSKGTMILKTRAMASESLCDTRSQWRTRLVPKTLCLATGLSGESRADRSSSSSVLSVQRTVYYIVRCCVEDAGCNPGLQYEPATKVDTTDFVIAKVEFKVALELFSARAC